MYTLDLSKVRFAVVRMDADDALPDWLDWTDPFVTVTRTGEELSIICPDKRVPAEAKAERNLRLLSVKGPMSFDLTGVLHQLTRPLAEAEIWILAISSYDTDFILVKDADLQAAMNAMAGEFVIID